MSTHPWNGLTPMEILRHCSQKQRVVMLHSGRVDARWSRYTYLATPSSDVYRFDGEPGRKPFAELRKLDSGAMWIGYISYDIAPWIERLPTRARRDRDWPIMWFARCDACAVYDGLTRTWSNLGDCPKVVGPQQHAFDAGPLEPMLARRDYESRVGRVKDYIAAGDVFQVNLSQRFTADFRGNPRALYERLTETSPAWYGAYLEIDDRHTIASISPELFLDVRGRNVVTRPIKGTRPATASPDELRDSAKDAAELHMIVDLLRNDLGRVCAFGSIDVKEPRVIETHPTVHHGVATVTGTLHDRYGLADLLRATLPGGSITGAPKVRAMQIIDELEPVRRGPYCGAIGFIHGDRACFNIAIRTLLLEDNQLDLHVGGGIVADSDPAAEYEETLVKAEAMKAALSVVLSKLSL